MTLIRPLLTHALPLALAAATSLSAQAQELRLQCYSDGNECEVTGEIVKRFEVTNPGAKVIIDKVPYKAVVEQLPVQPVAGEGPDIARVTDLGGLNKYYLDLKPLLPPARAKAWADNFSSFLAWFRAGPADEGIYGLTLPPENVPIAEWFNASKEYGNDEDSAGALHAGVQAGSSAPGDRRAEHGGGGKVAGRGGADAVQLGQGGAPGQAQRR